MEKKNSNPTSQSVSLYEHLKGDKLVQIQDGMKQPSTEKFSVYLQIFFPRLQSKMSNHGVLFQTFNHTSAWGRPERRATPDAKAAMSFQVTNSKVV